MNTSGENNHNCKLKSDQVKEIYRLSWETRFTQKEIADRFGTTSDNVRMIKLGKTWSHLTKVIKNDK